MRGGSHGSGNEDMAAGYGPPCSILRQGSCTGQSDILRIRAEIERIIYFIRCVWTEVNKNTAIAAVYTESSCWMVFLLRQAQYKNDYN